MKHVMDPVHGEIAVPDDFLPIVDHPLFQRLREVKQLGVAYLVYPGATHTRFSHCLGAFHVAKAFDDPAVMLYALVHDLGHPPLSHVTESALQKAGVKFDHDEHVKLYLKELLSGTTFSLADLKNVKRHKGALVDGDLGVDRMDYLTRDSYYTGVTVGNIPWRRLVRLMEVKRKRTVIHPKALGAVEHFFIARFIMGSVVYLHKTVLIAQAMVTKAIKRLLEDHSYEEIVGLDDIGLISLFRSHERAGQIWRKIESRDLFKRVAAFSTKKEAQEAERRLRDELGDDAVLMGRRPRWYKPIRVYLASGERLLKVSPLVDSLTRADYHKKYYFVAVDAAHRAKAQKLLK
jgi:HD superfamily phosphohydrolase